MTIKVAFIGLGRMGRAALMRVIGEGEFQVVAAFDVVGVGSDAGGGVRVTDASQLGTTLMAKKPDVVVDFSTAEACLRNAKTVAAAGASMVIGTTGFTNPQLVDLKNALMDVGAVISPNMSVGVNVFLRLVGEAAGRLKGYDVEVIEAHHKDKKDAPSGTALKAVREICNAVGADFDRDVVYGRRGDSKRRAGEIGVHSIRAGDIVGEHTVMFASDGERFEVKHVARSRDSFASGLPQAIRFIKGRKGIYDMADVLGLK